MEWVYETCPAFTTYDEVNHYSCVLCPRAATRRTFFVAVCADDGDDDNYHTFLAGDQAGRGRPLRCGAAFARSLFPDADAAIVARGAWPAALM
jgi:hypothetical protein